MEEKTAFRMRENSVGASSGAGGASGHASEWVRVCAPARVFTLSIVPEYKVGGRKPGLALTSLQPSIPPSLHGHVQPHPVRDTSRPIGSFN